MKWLYLLFIIFIAGPANAGSPLLLLGAGSNSTNTAIFPLSVSNGVLVNAQSQPFLMIGDSPQSLIGKLQVCAAGNTYALCAPNGVPVADSIPTNNTIVAYLRDRQAKGFNTIMVDMLCASYTSCPATGMTFDGVAPFIGRLGGGCTETTDQNCYDLATPNTAVGGYWERVDTVIKLAALFNIQVLLVVLETGGDTSCGPPPGGPSWLRTFYNNYTVATSKVTNFGTFVGNRYNTGAFPNLIYQTGNDYQCYQTAGDDAPVFAFASAIKAADTTHLLTSVLSYHISSSLDDTTNNWASILDLNGTYTYYPLYDETIHAVGQPPAKPVMLNETYYDGESATGCTGDGPSPFRDRKQEWWALTSGSNAGYMYGDTFTWQFSAGWNNPTSNIDTTSVTQLGYMTSLIKSVAWQKLVPDSSSTLVTAGRNTYANPPVTSGTPGGACAAAGVNVGGNTYVSAARANDGTFAIVYLPNSNAITVAVNTLGSNVTAQWYNPTSGAFTSICSNGAGVCASGSQTFNPATQGLSTHADGASDWVLLLQAAGAATPHIASVTLSNGNNFTTPASANSTIDTLTANCDAGSCAGSTFILSTSANAPGCASAANNGSFAISGSNLNIGNSQVTANTYTIGIAVTLAGATNNGACFPFTLTGSDATLAAGFFVSPSGSDNNNVGNLPFTSPQVGANAPFATLGRCQTAMRAVSNANKNCYIRAGTYQPLTLSGGAGFCGQVYSNSQLSGSAVILTSSDSNETWSYYPPDGVLSAIIDGQSTQGQSAVGTGGIGGPGNGLGCIFSATGATGVTINGLTLTRFAWSAVYGSGSNNLLFKNNEVRNQTGFTFNGGAATQDCATGVTIDHNYFHDLAAFGTAFISNSSHGCDNTTISNNVFMNTCTWPAVIGGGNDQNGGDCGAIYFQDVQGGTPGNSTGISVTNNYVQDVNVSSNGNGNGACCANGIYFDDSASNATVTGNIFFGKQSQSIFVHGGNNVHVVNNIMDMDNVTGYSPVAIMFFNAGTGGLQMTGNTVQNNIIVSSLNATGSGYHIQASAPNPAAISNNFYKNFVGASIATSGDAGTDSNPVQPGTSPQINCWGNATTITAGSPVFNTPVNFLQITGGWGPPGLTIPQTGTAPSWPHAC